MLPSHKEPAPKHFVETNRSVFGPVTLLVVLRMAIAEMLGTALLVLLGCMGSVVGLPGTPSSFLLISLNFGFVIMIASLVVGHISKCHINPAVTAGLVIYGDISIALALVYVLCQCIGAIIGYGLLLAVLPLHLPSNISNAYLCVTQPAPQITLFQAVFLEMMITGTLVLVVCGVFDWRNAAKEDSTPIKFGLTVAALAMIGGPFTGASMNPARSLGPVVWTGLWKNHWIYWVGPLSGGIIVSTFYRFVFRIPRPTQPDSDLEQSQDMSATSGETEGDENEAEA